MLRLKVSTVLVSILLLISVWNAIAGLSQYAHWPLFADDEWAQAATRTQARRLLRAVTQALNTQSCGRLR